MTIDDRFSLHTYKGQRAAIQDLFVQYLTGQIDHEIVKGSTALIREARMILTAELQDNKSKPSVEVTTKIQPTANGPFPRLIKK